MDRSLIAVAMMGAHWVLELLIAPSVLSVAVMIERIVFYVRHRGDRDELARRLAHLFDDGNIERAYEQLAESDAMEARVLAEGLLGLSRGQSVEAIMDSETTRQKARFEKRLTFLGTLGNNAPFIGLFGTVLGIIKAFHDLSLNDPSRAGTGAQAVMAGVSEALVATAVGLAVALPAVVAFNYFKTIVKGAVANTDSLSKLLCANADKLRGVR